MLKNCTWISENAEIYTPVGWVPITSISKISEVITYNKGMFETDTLTEFNVRNFSGKLPTRKSNLFFQGFIHTLDNHLNNVVLKGSLQPYKGKLYNLQNQSNSLIIRFVFKNENNQDYIICQNVLQK